METATKNLSVRIAAIAIIVAYVVAIFSCIVVFANTSISSNNRTNDDLYELSDGWTLETVEGSSNISLPAKITTQGNSATIRRTITSEESNLRTLLFYESRSAVSVTVTGTPEDSTSEKTITIYSINTDPELRKHLLVSTYCTAEIPFNSNHYTLSITFANTESDTINIPVVNIGTKNAALGSLLEKDIPTLACVLLFSFLVLALLTITIFAVVQKVLDRRILYLAIMLLDISIWGFCDSNLGIYLGLNPEMLGLISYIALALIPIAPLLFIYHSLSRKYTVLHYLLAILSIGVTVEFIVSGLGLVPMHKFLVFNHSSIIAMLIAGLGTSLKDYLSFKSRIRLLLVIDNAILSCLAILTLFAYFFGGPGTYRNLLLISIAIFVLGLFFIVVTAYVSTINNRSLQKKELEIYQALSTKDSLTNLSNRRAFDEVLEKIDQRDPQLNATLIILDLNGLKYTNDYFGHGTGDELIAIAARAIEKAYGSTGECFRIGGDEFAVVFKSRESHVEEMNKQLELLQDEHNDAHEYKLSIAHGQADLISNAGNRKTISDWKLEADVNMYRNKITTQAKTNITRSNELRETTRMIITMEEAKDPYTAHHSDRVKTLSSFLARKFGLSEATVIQIEEAAILHDIGKIGVSDKVLTKEGPLTEEELDEIKQHPIIGARILRNAKSMGEISTIVLHHHERYDGKGYPDGLKGDDIPLGSRIISLADSIDAMTSNRCYRDALSLDQCREQIEINSNIMYDPALAQITLENWDEITSIVLANIRECVS